jgi:hypothetical protein
MNNKFNLKKFHLGKSKNISYLISIPQNSFINKFFKIIIINFITLQLIKRL